MIKKNTSILVLAILIAMSLPLSLLSGDLGCPDLSDCDGAATCGTDGRVDGCTIYCSDSSTINCPPKGGGGGDEPIYPEL